MMQETTHLFETESKMEIGKTTYIVVAHFDESSETLRNKICQLLESKVESQIAQVRGSA